MDKIKYTIEYPMRSVPEAMLWRYISTPQGLESWFADGVSVQGKHYTFSWGTASQQASLVSMRSGVYVRFRWVTSDVADKTGRYFELRITRSELTDAVTLVVTDHADDELDVQEMTTLWNQQVETLRRAMGL